MEVRFGQSAPLRQFTLKGDGLVSAEEFPTAPQDGFVASVEDPRLGQFLRTRQVAALGPGWVAVPVENPGRHVELRARHPQQELYAEFASRLLTLRTGEHEMTAHFQQGSGRLVLPTVVERYQGM